MRATFITTIDNTIELLVVTSSFVMIQPSPQHLLARLKDFSTSIRSALSMYATFYRLQHPSLAAQVMDLITGCHATYRMPDSPSSCKSYSQVLFSDNALSVHGIFLLSRLRHRTRYRHQRTVFPTSPCRSRLCSDPASLRTQQALPPSHARSV